MLLWLAFAPITANAARSPGFVVHPDLVPYPWPAALVTWALLGLETGILYIIIRSPRRFRIAWSLVTLLFVLCAGTTVTDMPGYYYMPLLYQLVLVLAFFGAWTFRKAYARSGRTAA